MFETRVQGKTIHFNCIVRLLHFMKSYFLKEMCISYVLLTCCSKQFANCTTLSRQVHMGASWTFSVRISNGAPVLVTASCALKQSTASYLSTTRGFETVSYRGALLSTLLHAAVYVFICLFHILLNALARVANKMGLRKNASRISSVHYMPVSHPVGSYLLSAVDVVCLNNYQIIEL
jgi:hypothetical protein